MASNTVKMSYIHKPALCPMEHRTAVQLFDIHATTHPDLDAFVFYSSTAQRSSYTFRQIQEMSLSLAASFLRLGWKQGQRVCLMVPKQVEFVASYIALMRIGVNAILLPVYGRPADEVVAHMKRLRCNGFIIHADSVDSFDIQGITTDVGPVVLIESGRAHTGTSEDNCRNYSELLNQGKELGVNEVLKRQDEIQFDDPATVVFSSGSTGQPKAVQCTHHALVNGMQSSTTPFAVGTRFFNDRPFCWIGGLREILNVMANGYTAVELQAKTTVKESDLEFVLNVLQNEKCVVALLMPYILNDLLTFSNLGDYDLSSLKLMGTGGQNINMDVLKSWKAIFPDKMMLVVYAMSEGGFAPVGIRMLLPNTAIEEEACVAMEITSPFEVKIIDENKCLVPLGTVGEIAIRSPTTCVEYLEDPDETSKVISSTGWIHTADLGYMDERGRITICGRQSEMIKRATVKIYPAEVEQILIKHPDVNDVIVVGVPDARLYEEFCACVIPKQGSSLDSKVFEEWDYLQPSNYSVDEQGLEMRPKYTLLMEEFPTNKNGKIDRKAVREMAVRKLGI